MRELGGGLTWDKIGDMEYPDYNAVILCMNAYGVAEELNTFKNRSKTVYNKDNIMRRMGIE